MCRNHRGFVHTTVAAGRLGCSVVPLNSDFAGPQLADVLAREGVSAAVYDEEFEELFDDAGFEGVRIIAWNDRDPERPTIDGLIALGGDQVPPPAEHGQTIMLTSGTTGTPKGAVRKVSAVVAAAARRRRVLRPGPDQAGATIGRAPDCRAAAVSPVRADRPDGRVCARLADRDPPALRSRGDARADRADRRRRDARGADDAGHGSPVSPADRRDRYDTLLAADGAQRRRTAVRGARAGGPRSIRGRPLQRLRIDRGRRRHARDPGGPPGGPGHRRPADGRRQDQNPGRGRQRAAAPARPAGSSSAAR